MLHSSFFVPRFYVTVRFLIYHDSHSVACLICTHLSHFCIFVVTFSYQMSVHFSQNISCSNSLKITNLSFIPSNTFLPKHFIRQDKRDWRDLILIKWTLSETQTSSLLFPWRKKIIIPVRQNSTYVRHLRMWPCRYLCH